VPVGASASGTTRCAPAHLCATASTRAISVAQQKYAQYVRKHAQQQLDKQRTRRNKRKYAQQQLDTQKQQYAQQQAAAQQGQQQWGGRERKRRRRTRIYTRT